MTEIKLDPSKMKCPNCGNTISFVLWPAYNIWNCPACDEDSTTEELLGEGGE